MYAGPGYRTLIGRIRENVRTYIRKQIELPRQEVTEIVQANLRAVKWFGVALVLLLLFLVSFVILLIALLANVLPGGDALRAFLVSSTVVTLLLVAGAGFAGWRGYRSLDICGPERSIESFKETMSWARSRLLGRSES